MSSGTGAIAVTASADSKSLASWLGVVGRPVEFGGILGVNDQATGLPGKFGGQQQVKAARGAGDDRRLAFP